GQIAEATNPFARLESLLLERRPHAIVGPQPHSRGGQLLGRNIDRSHADILACLKLDLLEGHGLPGDLDVAKTDVGLGSDARRETFARGEHAAFEHRLSVIVSLATLDVGDLAIEVEVPHQECLAMMKIDRLWIDEFWRTDRIDVG